MTISYELDLNAAMSPDEIAEIEALRDRPIVYDEDCPRITPEMARKGYRPGKKREGDFVSMLIQVSPSTLEKAKTFGENYVAKMGELLDKAVANFSIEGEVTRSE